MNPADSPERPDMGRLPNETQRGLLYEPATVLVVYAAIRQYGVSPMDVDGWAERMQMTDREIDRAVCDLTRAGMIRWVCHEWIPGTDINAHLNNLGHYEFPTPEQLMEAWDLTNQVYAGGLCPPEQQKKWPVPRMEYVREGEGYVLRERTA